MEGKTRVITDVTARCPLVSSIRACARCLPPW